MMIQTRINDNGTVIFRDRGRTKLQLNDYCLQGGYTALEIAMDVGHKEISMLLYTSSQLKSSHTVSFTVSKLRTPT